MVSAAAGKSGFRLSLRAYAPEVDYNVMTRQALGRRVVRAAPAESLGVRLDEYAGLFAAVIKDRTRHEPRRLRARVHILGTLQARLTSFDRVRRVMATAVPDRGT